MSIEKEKLEMLQSLLKAVQNSVTKEEFAVSFKAVYDFVNKIKANNDLEIENIKSQFNSLSMSLQRGNIEEVAELKNSLNNIFKDSMAEMRVEHDAKMQQIDEKLAEVRDGEDGEDGKDADEDVIVDKVLLRIPKLTPEELADMLESLPGDKRLDANAIKNLPEPTKTRNIAGGRYVQYMADVKLTDIQDGEVLAWDADNRQFVNAAAGMGSGVDTANNPNAGEFARFTDADTIEGLTAAEIKSALDLEIGTDIQAYSANLDEYAAVNPTAAGLALLDDADTAAQLVTLGFTASITELNYTDGVTSNIQTQLDAKISNATHTGEVTGSGALTVDKTAISNRTQVNAAVGDMVLIGDASDSSNLKKATVQSIVDLASGSGISESLAIAYAVSL